MISVSCLVANMTCASVIKTRILVISISSCHQIHIAIISGILMLLQFIAYQMQLPKLLLGKDSLTVSF